MYFLALIVQTRSGLGPHITGSDESVNTTTKAATRFTKNEACYSRSGDKSCILLYAWSFNLPLLLHWSRGISPADRHVMFFSHRSLPLQQQRRGRVDDIEFNLMQHPLALFPHLEESLPPDVSCHRLGLVAKLVFFGLNVVHLTVNWYSSNLFVFWNSGIRRCSGDSWSRNEHWQWNWGWWNTGDTS